MHALNTIKIKWMKFGIQITSLLSQLVIEKTNNKLIFPLLTSNPPTNLSGFGGNAAVLTNDKNSARNEFTFRTVEMEVFGTS